MILSSGQVNDDFDDGDDDGDDFDDGDGDEDDFYDSDDNDCFAGVGKGRPDHHLYNPPAISQVPFVTILMMVMVMMIL